MLLSYTYYLKIFDEKIAGGSLSFHRSREVPWFTTILYSKYYLVLTLFPFSTKIALFYYFFNFFCYFLARRFFL